MKSTTFLVRLCEKDYQTCCGLLDLLDGRLGGRGDLIRDLLLGGFRYLRHVDFREVDDKR
jgi:hypothetical protein